MKFFSATLISILTIGTAMAQVPNGGFEDWADNVPVSWSNNNVAILDAYATTPSNEAHTGSLAARGEVIVNPVLDMQTLPPFLQSIGEIPLTENPSFCSGWYQFSPIQASASLVMSCTVLDDNDLPTGIGILEISEAAGSYTSFNIPIDYSIGGTDPGVSAVISFTISDNNDPSAVGSTFLLDDISLEGTVGIEDNQSVVSSFKTPYPSPFATSTTIAIEMESSAQIQIEVLDLLGRPMHTVVNSVMAPGSHLLQWTPESSIANGVYIVRVSHPSGTIARRVLLQR